MKVLHVGAEIFPLVKTGGLADVLGALPQALATQGADVRLLLPGLPAIIDAVLHAEAGVRDRPVLRRGARDAAAARRCRTASVPVYVIDAPYLYRRGGGPYQDADGAEWADNLQRFALLGWVAAHLAAGRARPGLGARRACMRTTGMRRWPAPTSPRTRPTQAAIGLHRAQPGLPGPVPARRLGAAGPAVALHVAGGAGVPRPAVVHEGGPEVRRPRHHRQPDLRARDRHARVRLRPGRRDPRPRRAMSSASSTASTTRSGTRPPTPPSPQRYERRAARRARRAARRRCRRELGLAADADAPLLGVVSRLTSQKGLDLVLAALPALLPHGRAAGGAGHRRAGAGGGLPHGRSRRTRGAWRCASATTRRSRTG